MGARLARVGRSRPLWTLGERSGGRVRTVRLRTCARMAAPATLSSATTAGARPRSARRAAGGTGRGRLRVASEVVCLTKRPGVNDSDLLSVFRVAPKRPLKPGANDLHVLSIDKEVDVIPRKLVIVGISAMALTPGVAWACSGIGHPGPGGPIGATGVTGSTGWSGPTGTSGVTSASLRSAGLHRALRAHLRKPAGRG
jgi:hypothetical protein